MDSLAIYLAMTDLKSAQAISKLSFEAPDNWKSKEIPSHKASLSKPPEAA